MKITFRILLVACIAVLGYLCVKSIMDPIKFEQEKTKRESAIIRRLINIRKAQIEYRNMNGQYTASFDTLIDFVKNGKLKVVLKEGVLSDMQLADGLTDAKVMKMSEKERIAKGLENFKRDTTLVSVRDSLFGAGYTVDSMRFVPGTRTMFEMAAAELPTASGLTVKVFEAKTTYDVYLGDLDRQEVINLKDRAKKLDKFAGLQVGSINEANNNAGNWE
ncbi:MAG: hypothetical protein ACRC6R_02260 [Bacteroidales bacterium]